MLRAPKEAGMPFLGFVSAAIVSYVFALLVTTFIVGYSLGLGEEEVMIEWYESELSLISLTFIYSLCLSIVWAGVMRVFADTLFFRTVVTMFLVQLCVIFAVYILHQLQIDYVSTEYDILFQLLTIFAVTTVVIGRYDLYWQL